ncbi:MAG: YeeE/YedE family protein [Burkholderiales bacterium]|nr:YeeE/YedE family protein [Burkholderiales bacterium]
MSQNTSVFSNASEYLIGVLFGLGLMISGMTNPAKILAFLDLSGAWDPSLIFVMGGAVLVGLIAFYLAKNRTQSFLGGAMHMPTRRDIDRPLLIGSAMFGLGWGLAGFCPGPAFVSLGSGELKALAFVIAMLGGMLLFDFLGQKK